MLDNEAQTTKRKESAAQRQKRLTAAISDVLASESGRLVLAEILGMCQVEQINGQEGVAAGRIEGARAVGIQTISMLRANDPGGWMKLYKELHHAR